MTISYKEQQKCRQLSEFMGNDMVLTNPDELFREKVLSGEVKSQQEKILEVFKDGNYHNCKEFLRLGIAQYGARIKELRWMGYKIRNDYDKKKKKPFFRLV